MRLAAFSDIAATGFGRVGRELISRWVEAGADVRVLGMNFRGREGEVVAALNAGKPPEAVAELMRHLDTDPVLSRTHAAAAEGDLLGNNLTARFLAGAFEGDGWQAEKAFVVADPRAMLERLVTDQGALSRLPTWNYVPIEGVGLSPFWRPVWEKVRPVAMSTFGAEQLERLMGRTGVPVIRHGLSDAFFPVSPERPGVTSRGEPVPSREEARERLGWTDRTVILRTDRNVPRKDYPAFFDAIRPVIAKHPDVLVVIHCAPIDEGGILSEWIAGLPGAYDGGNGWRHSQVHQTRAHDTWQGLTDDQLNIVYNAADIYFSPTAAEGFGLTLLEAVATGLPVVTTDFAAGPEAVGPGGICVPPRWLQGNPAAHRWSVADTGACTEALLHLIEHPEERARLGALGAEHARGFSWDAAALAFLRLFESA